MSDTPLTDEAHIVRYRLAELDCDRLFFAQDCISRDDALVIERKLNTANARIAELESQLARQSAKSCDCIVGNTVVRDGCEVCNPMLAAELKAITTDQNEPAKP